MIGQIVHLDVLGYKSFIRNCQSSVDAKAVLKLINDVPGNVQAHLIQSFGGNAPHDIELVSKQVKVRVYSDTILLFVNNARIPESSRDLAWIYTIEMAVDIFESLWNVGLPLRGCIHYGEVVLYKNSAAGIGFLEAISCGSDLDMACIEVSEDAKSMIEHEAERRNCFCVFAREMITEYIAPCKDGVRSALLIDWTARYFSKLKYRDFGKLVSDSLSGCCKGLSADVQGKLDNTRAFLSCMMLRDIHLRKNYGCSRKY